jgi:hypothetical protein
VQPKKQDLHSISTDAGTWIVFKPLLWNAYSSIRCNLELDSNVIDVNDLQLEKHSLVNWEIDDEIQALEDPVRQTKYGVKVSIAPLWTAILRDNMVRIFGVPHWEAWLSFFTPWWASMSRLRHDRLPIRAQYFVVSERQKHSLCYGTLTQRWRSVAISGIFSATMCQSLHLPQRRVWSTAEDQLSQKEENNQNLSLRRLPDQSLTRPIYWHLNSIMWTIWSSWRDMEMWAFQVIRWALGSFLRQYCPLDLTFRCPANSIRCSSVIQWFARRRCQLKLTWIEFKSI